MWRERRCQFDGDTYWTMRTALGECMVMEYSGGWGASINFAGTDADRELGRLRKTPRAARNDAERFLRSMYEKLGADVAPRYTITDKGRDMLKGCE